MERKGFTEECYFTFSYSPINIENGDTGGCFYGRQRNQRQVIGERRLDTLRELGSLGSNARTAAQAAAARFIIQSARPAILNLRQCTDYVV